MRSIILIDDNIKSIKTPSLDGLNYGDEYVILNKDEHLALIAGVICGDSESLEDTADFHTAKEGIYEACNMSEYPLYVLNDIGYVLKEVYDTISRSVSVPDNNFTVRNIQRMQNGLVVTVDLYKRNTINSRVKGFFNDTIRQFIEDIH